MNIECPSTHDFAKLTGALKLFLQDRKQLASGSELCPEIADTLRHEYDKNGLEGVDSLSEAVNSCLLSDGFPVGFGSGCGLIEAGQTKRLYLFFVELDTERVISRRFIDLI